MSGLLISHSLFLFLASLINVLFNLAASATMAAEAAEPGFIDRLWCVPEPSVTVVTLVSQTAAASIQSTLTLDYRPSLTAMNLAFTVLIKHLGREGGGRNQHMDVK